MPLVFILCFYALALQNMLEGVWGPFGYLDEMFAVLAIILLVWRWGGYYRRNNKLLSDRSTIMTCAMFSVFMFSGLLGNIIYQYQPLSAVIIDLFTNMKFFLAIVTAYILFGKMQWNTLQSHAKTHTRLLSVITFIVFVADRIFNFFPAEVRHGIKSARLYYGHPTYLAGAMIFLITMLTIFYQKTNLPYIAMDLIVLGFTLRGKALAGVVIYTFFFLFFIVWKKRQLKVWQMALVAIAVFALAWSQVHFYFIELYGRSARSVVTITSIQILKDYFPIGTGFGTYASHVASVHYSPVYLQYGFDQVYELRPMTGKFFDDWFWPIIIGQTGFVGTVAYVGALCGVFRKCLSIKKSTICIFMGILFAMAYLLVSSTSEPAFNNSIAIPLAMVIGIVFNAFDNGKIDMVARPDETGNKYSG